MELSLDDQQRLEQLRWHGLLDDLKDPNSEASKRYRASLEKIHKDMQPELDAIEQSERITERDLQIVINY